MFALSDAQYLSQQNSNFSPEMSVRWIKVLIQKGDFTIQRNFPSLLIYFREIKYKTRWHRQDRHRKALFQRVWAWVGLLLFSHQAMSDSAAPWTAARQASPSFTISRGWLKPMSVESVMPSTHLILCRPFSWVGHVWVKGAAPWLLSLCVSCLSLNPDSTFRASVHLHNWRQCPEDSRTEPTIPASAPTEVMLRPAQDSSESWGKCY